MRGTVVVQLRRSYGYRMAFLGALTGGLGAMLAWQGLRLRMPLMAGFGIFVFALTAAIHLREYLRGARVLDEAGVTRRDGMRFAWVDLREVRRVHGRLPGGQMGALNHFELRFAGGAQVRVFPLVVANLGEVSGFVEGLEAELRLRAV